MIGSPGGFQFFSKLPSAGEAVPLGRRRQFLEFLFCYWR